MAKKAKKEGPGPGRKTLLTPEVSYTICDALERGNFLETAAALAGISSRSVRDWMTKGRKGDNEVFRAFFEAVQRSNAIAEDNMLKVIAQETSWQATAWRLERRFPKRWGRRKVTTEHVIKDERADPIDKVVDECLGVLSPENLSQPEYQ